MLLVRAQTGQKFQIDTWSVECHAIASSKSAVTAHHRHLVIFVSCPEQGVWMASYCKIDWVVSNGMDDGSMTEGWVLFLSAEQGKASRLSRRCLQRCRRRRQCTAKG
jgi:hypothetical protein